MGTWFVQEPGAVPMGPLPESAIVQRISDGRISVRAKVRAAEAAPPGARDPWRDIEGIPAFARALAHSSRALPSPERSALASAVIVSAAIMALFRVFQGLMVITMMHAPPTTVLLPFLSACFYTWATIALAKGSARACGYIIRVNVVLAALGAVNSAALFGAKSEAAAILLQMSPLLWAVTVLLPVVMVGFHVASAVIAFKAKDEFREP
jgi:hypothetical protein